MTAVAPERANLAAVRRVTGLRAELCHLSAQVEAGTDSNVATAEEAGVALREVEASLAAAEDAARGLPEAAHLFAATRKRAGRIVQSSTSCVRTPVPPPTKEANMASKSNGAALEEVLVALRRAEKSAGTTKWALSGAGAAKNPPSAAKKKALKAKLTEQQAKVAELRAQRDELKAKV